MKRLTPTATALALSLLTGAANAAPTCHQKVAVVGMTNFDKVLPIVNKINPLINDSALTLISSTSDDRADAASDFTASVVTAIRTVTKTNKGGDAISSLTTQIADSLVTNLDTSDRFTPDMVARNNVKAMHISLAVNAIVSGYLICN